jgi:hypothetical protein
MENLLVSLSYKRTKNELHLLSENQLVAKKGYRLTTRIVKILSGKSSEHRQSLFI